RHLVSGSLDGTVRIFRTDKDSSRVVENAGPIHALAVAPNGLQMVSGGEGDHTMRLWDVTWEMQLRRFEGHRGRVHCLAFAPDNQTILSGSADGTVRLWDAASGRQRHCFEGHRGVVTGVAFPGDVRLAISGDASGEARIWDLDSGNAVHAF